MKFPVHTFKMTGKVSGLLLVMLFVLARPDIASSTSSLPTATSPVTGNPAVSTTLPLTTPAPGYQVGEKPKLYALKNKRRKKRQRKRRIRRAIGAAIGAAIIVNELSRASRGHYDGRGQCWRWRRSCDRGHQRACRRFYRNC